MSSKTTEQRLTENEIIIREKNSKVSKGLKKYFRNDKSVVNAPVAFVCECSNLKCDQLVNLSIKEYEKLHRKRNRFTIYTGHVKPEVEKVIDQKKDFDIVEKYALSPAN